MPPSKRKHEDHDGEIVALAAAVRRSSQKDELSDAILAAMESGAPLPSTKLAKGPKFAEVPDEACFVVVLDGRNHRAWGMLRGLLAIGQAVLQRRPSRG